MKKLLAVLILCLAVATAASAAETAQTQTFGFLFEMKNLLLSIDSYDDGFQTGLGLKYWLMKNLALRGVVSLDMNIDPAGVLTADIGLGCGAEYHPVATAKVSPYFGGFAGVRMAIAAENAIDIYFGGMAGAEMRVWENIAVFAEYDLLARIDAEGFTIGLEAGGGAQVGLIMYF